MPYDCRRVQKPRPAEVARPLSRVRKSIDEASVDCAVVVEAVDVNKPERFAPPGNLSQGELLAADCIHEEIPGVQLIVGEKIVDVAVQLIRAGFRGVSDE